MRLRSSLWFSLAWVLAPLTLLAAQLYQGSVFPSGSGYPLAEQVGAFGSTVLVLPLTCLICCVFGSRLKRSALLRCVTVRRPLLLVFFRLILLPCLAATAALALTMVGASISQAGNAGLDPSLLLAAILGSLAYAGLGLALGTSLSPIFAAPLAVIAPYALIAFPPAASNYWMRHITWISTGCCNIYETLSTRALGANLAFSASLLLISFAIFAFQARVVGARYRAIAAAGLGALVAFSSAVALALPLGVSPVDARSGEPSCDTSGPIALCLWQEHSAARERAKNLLLEVHSIAVSTRVVVPETLTELAPQDVRWPTSSVDLSPRMSDLTAGVAASLYPNTDCQNAGGSRGMLASSGDSDTSRTVVSLWWQTRLGQDVAATANEDADSKFNALMRSSIEDQTTQLNSMIKQAADTCSSPSPS